MDFSGLENIYIRTLVDGVNECYMEGDVLERAYFSSGSLMLYVSRQQTNEKICFDVEWGEVVIILYDTLYDQGKNMDEIEHFFSPFVWNIVGRLKFAKSDWILKNSASKKCIGTEGENYWEEFDEWQVETENYDTSFVEDASSLCIGLDEDDEGWDGPRQVEELGKDLIQYVKKFQ